MGNDLAEMENVSKEIADKSTVLSFLPLFFSPLLFPVFQGIFVGKLGERNKNSSFHATPFKSV